MKTKLQTKEKGFTIIEVLIVLAIAGLIMLIVFLAVPALQRNNRNTQRKNDVSKMLGAVSEHISNNNGTLPTTIGQITQSVKSSYYTTAADVTLNTSGTATNPDNVDKVIIVSKGKCSGNNAVPGTNRSVAVLYTLESGGAVSQQVCQES